MSEKYRDAFEKRYKSFSQDGDITRKGLSYENNDTRFAWIWYLDGIKENLKTTALSKLTDDEKISLNICGNEYAKT